jgi:hypothetical protein
MKNPSVFIIMLLFAAHAGADQNLPADIERAFVKNNPYISRGDAMSMDDPRFVEYVLKNWRPIAERIEILPEVEGDIPEKGVAFNVSVIAFSEACEKLPPMEYVDFLDRMLVLYEQRRISELAYEQVILPGLEKQDFLSVNYEHPRVEAILKKALSLLSPEEESLRSCLEKTASGALADNYKTDKSDDAPLPETLPGIKLKRPWDSLIKKYERITGKKLPPDPDFPENPGTRPHRRLGKGDAGEVSKRVSEGGGAWDSWKLPVIALALISVGLGIFKHARRKVTGAGQS